MKRFLTFLLFLLINFSFSVIVVAETNITDESTIPIHAQTYFIEKFQSLKNLDSSINNKFDELSTLDVSSSNFQIEFTQIYQSIQELFDKKDLIYSDIDVYRSFSIYFEYGLEYNPESKEIYFNNQKVRFFIDDQDMDPVPHQFSGILCEDPEGEINIVVERDSNKKIINLNTYPEDTLPEIYSYLLQKSNLNDASFDY